MFGVAPPQTLYHTRAPTAPSRPYSPAKSPTPRSPSTPPFRFTPSASSSSSAKSKGKQKRPGTGDSSEPLIEGGGDKFLAPYQSLVYMHYRHSLNSLNDIIERVGVV